MKIIFEDEHIIAIHKPAGLATQTKRLGEKDLFSEVKNYLKGCFVGIVNRLDQPVEGIVVIGKSPKATAKLTEQIQNGSAEKYYKAEVYISDATQTSLSLGGLNRLSDYMHKDERNNISHICEKSHPGAKEALLEYTVLAIYENKALLNIHLLTGRHHQIRLQMSNAGFPLLGDRKYGTESSIDFSLHNNYTNVALCAYKYIFLHPLTQKQICLELE